MRKHRYDEYEAHKAEHERLLDEIRDIMDGAEEDYGAALSETVRDWFVNHFKSKDARLHKRLGV
jgi:hemerythrin